MKECGNIFPRLILGNAMTTISEYNAHYHAKIQRLKGFNSETKYSLDELLLMILNLRVTHLCTIFIRHQIALWRPKNNPMKISLCACITTRL